MTNNINFDELNSRAVKYFKAHGIESCAVAVSGSEKSLVLLNAAVQVMGNEKVLAIVADTGYIPDKVLDIIEKACDMVNVERCILPVFLHNAFADDITNTTDYKQQIFEEMLQECWLLGFDKIAYACTTDTLEKDGNAVIATFDCVVAPMADE